jgi:hypothetical protein
MGIRRRIVIPVILALGTAASSLAVSAVPVAGAQASSAPAVAVASHVRPDYFYEG